MKSRHLLSLLLSPALLWTGCASQPFLSAPHTQEQFQKAERAGGMTVARASFLGKRLKPGLSTSEVAAILGEPDRKKHQSTPAAELHWHYYWNVDLGYTLDLVFERRGDQWFLARGNWWDS
jgi:hypothetical protein